MTTTETETAPRITYREMRTRAQEILDEEIKEQVLVGIELLNEKFGPNWVDHVDPSSLYMASGTSCVLGQVYGSYVTGCEMLGIEEGSVDDAFYRTGGTSRYPALNAAWKLVFRGKDA